MSLMNSGKTSITVFAGFAEGWMMRHVCRSLQERYGPAKEVAERRADEWLSKQTDRGDADSIR
jgi:hypothetical protein